MILSFGRADSAEYSPSWEIEFALKRRTFLNTYTTFELLGQTSRVLTYNYFFSHSALSIMF